MQQYVKWDAIDLCSAFYLLVLSISLLFGLTLEAVC